MLTLTREVFVRLPHTSFRALTPESLNHKIITRHLSVYHIYFIIRVPSRSL